MVIKFNTNNLYVPTQEEMDMHRKELNEYKRLGINVSVFSSNQGTVRGEYIKKELRAMSYIARGRKVPKKLEEYLLATKEERMAQYSQNEAVEIEDINLDD